MLKKHSHVFEGLLVSTDTSVISLVWIASYWLRFASELFPIDKGIPPFLDYLRMLPFVWMIWYFVFQRAGLYKAMRGVSRISESFKVLRANSLSVVLLMALTYLFREKSTEFSRLVFVIFFVCSSIAIVISRMGIREVLRYMRKRGHNLRYALVVGAGELAQNVVKRISAHPEFGIELLGCLDRTQPQAPIRMRASANAMGASLRLGTPAQFTSVASAGRAVKVIGRYEDLPKVLAQGIVDQVVIALPLEDHGRIPDIIASIGDEMVDVRIVPDLHRFIQLGSQIEELDGLPVVSLASTPLSGFNRVKKRAFDILFSLLFILITLPVMLLVALIVKLTSHGDVFFAQERMGLDGRVFSIFKFRTMHLDAEVEGAKFAVRNDPRVTLIGRFLRRFSVDELPQLFNVLCGQMSLVGPRPERPVFIEQFRKKIPKYMLRHKVQAGMTGWAQVNGWRGNTCLEKRIEHDLYYIENWSLLLDLRIILMTIYTSLVDKNAC